MRRKIACNQIRSSRISALPLADVSFKFNRCRIRCFNLSDYERVPDEHCGDTFESGDYPLEDCDGVTGFFIKDWAQELRPKIKKLDSVFKNYCD